jgi:hypothetical protein
MKGRSGPQGPVVGPGAGELIDPLGDLPGGRGRVVPEPELLLELDEQAEAGQQAVRTVRVGRALPRQPLPQTHALAAAQSEHCSTSQPG